MKEDPEILLSRLIEALPTILKLVVVNAQLHKAKYDALLMQGFTEAQALELCKVVP